jgi:hypothetical protein
MHLSISGRQHQAYVLCFVAYDWLLMHLQGDKVMGRFQQLCNQLEEAITTLPLRSIGIHEHPEITQQIKSLDTSLQAAKFDIAEKHMEALKTYKDACDMLAAPFDQVLNACKELLSQVELV